MDSLVPNRILRDWTDSSSIESISWQAEVLFVRLIMKADDFGRFHADACMLRASLFPRRLEKVREADISRWIAECEKAGLIALYESDGKKCLEIIKFGQTARATTSKFPNPIASRAQIARNEKADSNHDALVVRSSICGIRGSEIEDECAATASTKDRSQQKSSIWGKPPIQYDPVLRVWIGITSQDRNTWSEAYPAVNLDKDLAGMIAWIVANPRKGKKSNYVKFITGWLMRSQDRGGSDDRQSNDGIIAQPLTKSEIEEYNRLARNGKMETTNSD